MGKALAFQADKRLIADARPADPDTLLLNVRALKVVTHAPSVNVCQHNNWTVAQCSARCAFSDRNLHLRMPLVPTYVRLQRTCVRPMAFLSEFHSSYRLTL
jgi:hypothetical protein